MLNQKGFTLVELLVAMIIGIIGFLGMMAVQITSISATNVARNENAATLLGHGLTERFTFSAYTAAALTSGSTHPTSTDLANRFVHPNPIFANGSTASSAPGTQFTRTWTVLDNYSGSGQKMVTVRVTWGESGGVQKVRSFRYYKSQFY